MSGDPVRALILAVRVEVVFLTADAVHADDRGAAIIETRAAQLRELADQAEQALEQRP